MRLSESPARATFPKAVRLLQRRDFVRIYETGIRVVGRRLVLFVVPREDGPPRLGLTATRKIGSAVKRNYIRRLLRESFRRQWVALAPWDIVINARAGSPAASFVEVDEELRSLIRRARRAIGEAGPARR